MPRIITILFLLTLSLSACRPATQPSLPSRTPTETLPGKSPSPTIATTAPRSTSTPLPTNTAVPTLTHTPVPTPTATTTPSPIPTYTKLRGEVTIAQAVCHYGPGQPYLYKYGVIQGSNLEIIARDERSSYIEVQAIGGNNPCWLNAKYMQIKGDLNTVRPIPAEDVHLPMSPYYAALSSASAQRSGSQVTIAWTPLVLKAGDDSEQYDYLVEAWLCRAGEIWFTPIGSYTTSVQVTDEPGCSTPSHARVYGVEKHGYTRWLEVPWPAAQ